MHVKGIEQQMRLMTHSFPQALKFGLFKVLLQDGAVVWVRTVLDDFAGPFARTQTPDIGEALDVSSKVSFCSWSIPVPKEKQNFEEGKELTISVTITSKSCSV